MGGRRRQPGAAYRPVGLIREARYRDASVRIRECGRYLRVNVEPKTEVELPGRIATTLMRKHHWRLLDVLLAVRDRLPAKGEGAEPKA